MGRVILCMGRTATIPYYFDKLSIRVWSVEELCYCLRENAFLLEPDIVSSRLVEWIENECGLRELSESLKSLIHQRGSLPAFVVKILEYVGFYDEEVLLHVSNTLQSGASLSDYEKKKKRGDYFLRNKKYARAMQEYEFLLMELPGDEQGIKAEVLHNKGVAMAGLFLFEGAANEFMSAYELTGDRDYFRNYLAAKRMQYDDKEYISFVAGVADAYDVSIELEREINEILTQWDNSEELKSLNELWKLKEEGQRSLYYEEIDTRTQNLKELYRECVKLQ